MGLWISAEKDLACYRIYRADGTDGVYRLLEAGWTGKNYYDRNVEPRGIYRYRIDAVDLAGNASLKSDEALAQAAADTEAPQVLGISPSEGMITGANPVIRIWAADNNSLGIVTAWYREVEDETAIWMPLMEQKASGASRLCEQVLPTDGLMEGGYYIRASVSDAAGNQSEEVTVSFRLDLKAPEAPEIHLTRGGRKINLSWEGCGEEDFSHYELYRQSAYEDTDVIPETVYTYQLKCMDGRGNASWSEPVSGTASAEDATAPVARVPQEILAIEGMEVALDGTASSDNVKIVKYTWDIENGDRLSGVQPICVLKKAGDYSVTLTVEDAAGNRSQAVTRITALPADNSGSVKVRVTDTSGRPLAHAYVYVKLSEEERRNLRTDGEGKVTLSALAGPCQVAAYKEGYLPKEETVEIHNYQTGERTIALDAGDVVVET